MSVPDNWRDYFCADCGHHSDRHRSERAPTFCFAPQCGCMMWKQRHLSPVRSCCGTRHHGPICPDGAVRCCLCFDRFSIEELWIDKNGNREDVCRECGAAEQAVPSNDGSTP